MRLAPVHSNKPPRSRVRRLRVEPLEDRALLSVAPVLGPIPNQEVPEGTLLSVPITATDADAGDTLTFSLAGAPDGASIAPGSEPGSAVFTWTPPDGLVPPVVTQITVVVTDSEGLTA